MKLHHCDRARLLASILALHITISGGVEARANDIDLLKTKVRYMEIDSTDKAQNPILRAFAKPLKKMSTLFLALFQTTLMARSILNLTLTTK